MGQAWSAAVAACAVPDETGGGQVGQLMISVCAPLARNVVARSGQATGPQRMAGPAVPGIVVRAAGQGGGGQEAPVGPSQGGSGIGRQGRIHSAAGCFKTVLPTGAT